MSVLGPLILKAPVLDRLTNIDVDDQTMFGYRTCVEECCIDIVP